MFFYAAISVYYFNVFLFLSTTQPVLADVSFACLSYPHEKAVQPKKLCAHKIILERLPNCSLKVAEVMIMPHTNGSFLSRKLYFLPKQAISHLFVRDQKARVLVNEASIHCSGKKSDVSKQSTHKKSEPVLACEDDGVQIQIPTLNQSSEVIITLQYQVSNGVMKASGPCAAHWTRSNDSNAIVWRSDIGVRTNDFQFIVFSLNYSHSYRQFRFDETYRRGATVVRIFRAPAMKQILVEEIGALSCEQNMQCYLQVEVLPWVQMMTGAILIAVIGIWLVCCSFLRGVSMSKLMMEKLATIGIVRFDPALIETSRQW